MNSEAALSHSSFIVLSERFKGKTQRAELAGPHEHPSPHRKAKNMSLIHGNIKKTPFLYDISRSNSKLAFGSEIPVIQSIPSSLLFPTEKAHQNELKIL